MSNRILKLASLMMLVSVLGACDGGPITGPEDVLGGPGDALESPQAQAADDQEPDQSGGRDAADSEDAEQVKPRR